MATDEIAIELATKEGYYPEKTNGGVSKFLTDLVLREKSAKTTGGEASLPVQTQAGFVKQLANIRADITRLKEKTDGYGKEKRHG